jgi:hypothetical protein
LSEELLDNTTAVGQVLPEGWQEIAVRFREFQNQRTHRFLVPRDRISGSVCRIARVAE